MTGMNSKNTWFKLGHKFSEDILKKIRETKKGIHYSPKTEFKKGHIMPENIRIKIREALKGKHHSEETKGLMKEKRKHRVFLNYSSIEVKIQNFLKQLNIEFFTHQYIKEIEHGYQCDILIPSMKMVIECDGHYWHKYPVGKEIDHIRTREMLEKGFKVLRLWECEIKKMDIKDFEKKLGVWKRG